MSGCGRRHRAKHLTRQYLDATAWQGPAPGESLGVCLGTPQGQHVRVLLLTPPPPPPLTPLDESAAAAAQTAATTSSSLPSPAVAKACAETTSTSLAATATDDVAATHAPHAEALREVLAWLPGKFRKVIWLSVKDVVVLAQSTVQCKPSPEQLHNFMRAPTHAWWAERIRYAQEVAETRRRTVERLPLHIHMTSTTTSVLPSPPPPPSSTAPTDNAQRSPRAHDDATPCAVTRNDADDEEDGSGDDGDVLHMVNRNRNNIRHQQQYFCFGAQDDVCDTPDSVDDDNEDDVRPQDGNAN